MTKTALITGTSSGIGLELVTIFAQNKNNLLLAARNEDKLQFLATSLHNEFGVTVQFLSKDLSNCNTPKEIFDHCLDQNIQIDYMINSVNFSPRNMNVKIVRIIQDKAK